MVVGCIVDYSSLCCFGNTLPHLMPSSGCHPHHHRDASYADSRTGINRERDQNCLVLRMHAKTEHRNWASVAIVRWICDELIVQRNLRGKYRKTIISLEYFFAARIWQLAIANQDSKSAGIEKRLVHAGNPVDDTGYAERIVIPPPLLSGNR